MQTDDPAQQEDSRGISRSIAGDTLADNRSHVTARIHFLNLLIQEERWTELRTNLTREAGLATLANRARAALMVAETRGFDDEIMALAEEYHAQLHAAMLDAKLVGWVLEVIWEYVHETLRLPWRWVLLELFNQFMAVIGAWSLGEEQMLLYSIEPLRPTTPDINLSFSSVAGSDLVTVQRELREHLAQVTQTLRELDKPPIPRGKSRDPEVVRKSVSWFHRNYVLKESIRSIARTPITGDKTGISTDPRTVRKGIRDAVWLLDLDSTVERQGFRKKRGGGQSPEP